MNGSIRSDRARFLFRSEEGTIDAPTWRLHAGWLAGLAALMTAGWLVLRPFTHHDLATSGLIAPLTIVAFTYLILYSFAILLVAISYTMLSMKRLRDRGEPTGLAALVPLLALFSGALHFLHAQTPDVIEVWHVVLLDALLVGSVIWTVADLGFRPRGPRRSAP